MESCLGELHLQQCIIYLDDIIIFARTVDEHLSRLRAVFNKLEIANLKLKPSKCKFFQERIEHLGHIILKWGIETNPHKIEKVRNWPQPQNITDLCGFLGLCNYYCKLIENFSQKARPLYKLLTGIDKQLLKKGGTSKIGMDAGAHRLFQAIEVYLHQNTHSSICRLLKTIYCAHSYIRDWAGGHFVSRTGSGSP